MSNTKSHPLNCLCNKNDPVNQKKTHDIVMSMFGHDRSFIGITTDEKKKMDAVTESIAMATNHNKRKTAIETLISNGVIDESLKNKTTATILKYHPNIDKNMFTSYGLDESHWLAFQKSTCSEDRLAEGICMLYDHLAKLILEKEKVKKIINE